MELLLDDSCDIYFPGDKICGVFRIQECADSSIKPTVRVSGFTVVWKPGTSKETEEYSMFFEDIAVLISEKNNSNLSLNDELIGSKVLKFYFVLPDNLPPSHEVPFGHTRYKLEAYYNGQNIFRYFSVSQWVGLEKRNNKIMKSGQLSVSFLNLCQPIGILLTLNQTHYLPGETVYIEALTTNCSWKDIIFTKIFIVQTTKYWKTHHVLPIKHSRIVAEGSRGHLPGGCSQIWNKEPLYIPAVIPTTKKSNNSFIYFQVMYKLKVQITMKPSKTKTILKQHIFIGNWDKSTVTNSCIDLSTNNESPNEITASECSLIKLENIDFVPKYVIYETRQE